MNSFQDILITLIAIEFLIIAACIVLVTYFLIKALKSISSCAESIGRIKSFITIPALLVAIISKILKRR